MQKLTVLGLFIILTLMSCQQEEENVLVDLLKSNPNEFGDIIKNKDKYEVQILYTQINRDESNTPTFTSYGYNLDSLRYFYPASTVKMPIAFLALEKLNVIYISRQSGQPTKYSTIQIDSARAPQTAVTVDSTAPNNLPTVAHYIQKIFTVSDNDAYNRLYEFLGQNYITNTLAGRGYNETRIMHRLSAPEFDIEANRYTNPVRLYNGEDLQFQADEIYGLGGATVPVKNTLKGVGFAKEDGTIVNQPFDFSKKNFISIQDLQKMLKNVMFYEYVEPSTGFSTLDEGIGDFDFLFKAMSTLPRESKAPIYDKDEYYDSYGKFFMFGDSKENIPDNIRIFNKVGWAYGYLTDCAYIVDFENNVEFLLTATIHVNDNQIYNDGKYEYEEIGLPFLSNLGKVIYNYELTRERAYAPDLERYNVGWE